MVIGRTMSTILVSWNPDCRTAAPCMVLLSRWFTWPVMCREGMESKKEQAMPVMRLVAPGPEVAIVTPTVRETRQTASAAMAAACSFWTQTMSSFGCRPTASIMKATAPPVSV